MDDCISMQKNHIYACKPIFFTHTILSIFLKKDFTVQVNYVNTAVNLQVLFIGLVLIPGLNVTLNFPAFPVMARDLKLVLRVTRVILWPPVISSYLAFRHPTRI